MKTVNDGAMEIMKLNPRRNRERNVGLSCEWNDQSSPVDNPSSRIQRRRISKATLAAIAILVIGISVVLGDSLTNHAGATDSAPTIIDVRTAVEFAAGHLEGAINIPLDSTDFKEKVDALDRDSQFALHCGTGARADRVADFMIEQGFKGLIASYSLNEARDMFGVDVVGDLDLANSLNPTTNENSRIDNPPMCAITGESLFGVTR